MQLEKCSKIWVGTDITCFTPFKFSSVLPSSVQVSLTDQDFDFALKSPSNITKWRSQLAVLIKYCIVTLSTLLLIGLWVCGSILSFLVSLNLTVHCIWFKINLCILVQGKLSLFYRFIWCENGWGLLFMKSHLLQRVGKLFVTYKFNRVSHCLSIA